jgi:hypothetical protein
MGYGIGAATLNHYVDACICQGWSPLRDILRPFEARATAWAGSRPEIVDCPAVTLGWTPDRHECTLENGIVVALHCDLALLSSCSVAVWKFRDASFCHEPAVLVLL